MPGRVGWHYGVTGRFVIKTRGKGRIEELDIRNESLLTCGGWPRPLHNPRTVPC